MRRIAGFLVFLAAGVTASGCCEVQKQPGRCAACCYDNCVIPVAAGNVSEKPLTPVVPLDKTPLKRASVASEMAY